MHARSTTITGDPGSTEAGIAFVRDDVMPTITAMDGCVGFSLVVDRGAGRLIATSSWHDADAMRASDERLVALRARGAEIMSGAPEVDEWEVAAMHRDHPTHEGCCCRVTWAKVPDADAFAEAWKSQLLPRIERMAGFCSASLVVDRERGRTCGTVSFDSRAALEGSRDQASGIRDSATRDHGAQILDVAEMDLEIAHLRVPELV